MSDGQSQFRSIANNPRNRRLGECAVIVYEATMRVPMRTAEYGFLTGALFATHRKKDDQLRKYNCISEGQGQYRGDITKHADREREMVIDGNEQPWRQQINPKNTISF